MSTDKLDLAARAAGFAMACDEMVGGPTSRPPMTAPQPAAQKTARPRALETLPARVERQAQAWGLIGRGFWKTA